MDQKNDKREEGQPTEATASDQDKAVANESEGNQSTPKPRHATTQSVAESLARIRNQLNEPEKQQKASITLNVLGFEDPLTFHEKHTITVGRMNPNTNEQPDVDLSGLSLNAAGVSRMHLKLVFAEGSWHVEDTGSRNGTWLNGKLLMAYQRYRLRDGDQLRAGNIIIIVLTYTNIGEKQQEEKPVVNVGPSTSHVSLSDTLRLTSASIVDGQTGLSPEFVTNYLMPFLKAVIDMMQHVDRAKKRSQREIAISSIVFSNPVITVQLTCSHEIIQFMRNRLSVQRVSESPSVADATEGLQPVNLLAESAQLGEEQSGEIARHFAEEYLPLITPDQSLYYQRMLVPLFEACLDSHISVLA